MSKDTFIIDGLRSPIGLKNGNLVGMRPDDLASAVVKGLLDRNTSIDSKINTPYIHGTFIKCANC